MENGLVYIFVVNLYPQRSILFLDAVLYLSADIDGDDDSVHDGDSAAESDSDDDSEDQRV